LSWKKCHLHIFWTGAVVCYYGNWKWCCSYIVYHKPLKFGHYVGNTLYFTILLTFIPIECKSKSYKHSLIIYWTALVHTGANVTIDCHWWMSFMFQKTLIIIHAYGRNCYWRNYSFYFYWSKLASQFINYQSIYFRNLENSYIANFLCRRSLKDTKNNTGRLFWHVQRLSVKGHRIQPRERLTFKTRQMHI